jgi:Molybdenum cofactor biosynthesis enzyme
MKRVVILGTDERAEFVKLLIELKCRESFEVSAFCNYLESDNLCRKKVNGIEVITLEECRQKYLAWEIDAVILTGPQVYYRDLTRILNGIGIREVYCVLEYVNSLWLEKGENITVEEFLFPVDISKPCLRYYEFHLCDECNLKCKGCGHVSNIAKGGYPDLDMYIQDLQQLKKLFWGCQAIKLLGGEPLLNKELPQFIYETRKAFPEADIYVGTNGLLIPKADKDLFEVMKREHVYFMVSLYPPTFRMKDEIIQVCEDNGISIIFTPYINEFSTALYEEKQFDIQRACEKCRRENGYCFTLREGHISPCLTFYMEQLNDRMDAGFEVIPDEDYFDLYKYENGWELDEKLHSPIPFCAYCGKRQTFPWKAINEKAAKLSDYVNIQNV